MSERTSVSPDEQMKGWLCPRCGNAHAPDVKTCPQVSVAQQPGLWPGIPQQIDCGCPSNHVCMNVACPRRVQITCSGVSAGANADG